MTTLLTTDEVAAILRVSPWTVDPELARTVLSFGRAMEGLRQPTVLYRFFDAEGHLLYVGITTRGATRWVQHSHTAAWWPLVASVTVQHFEWVTEAAHAERVAIRSERPLYNVTHARGSR